MNVRLAVAASLVWLAACGGSAGSGGEGDTPAVVGARTARVTPQPFTEAVDALGTVVSRPGAHAALSAPSAARVARVLVSTGSRVAVGDTLVQLEPATFTANAASADAALASAQAAYDRAARLVAAGILPRKEQDQAGAAMAQARSAAVSARRDAELATLRAPIAGVITRVGAVLGASVDANQTLVELADPGAVDIVLTVSPGEAAGVRPGAAVRLDSGEPGAADSLGSGIVRAIGAAVDSLTRGVEVRVRPVDPRRPLRIGETIRGRIVIGVRRDALVIPAESLVPEGDAFHVFVVDSAGIAHARPVTVRGRSGATVELGGGLTAGETIVTFGAYGVEDGAKIVVAKP
jgi:RND family efflux transporter MFP subunit